MSRDFYIGQDGRRNGPYTESELKVLSLSERDLIWTEGMKDWQSVGEFARNNPGLFQNTAIPPPLPSRSAPPSLPNSIVGRDSALGSEPLRVEVSKKPNPKPMIAAQRAESKFRNEVRLVLILLLVSVVAGGLAYMFHFQDLIAEQEAAAAKARSVNALYIPKVDGAEKNYQFIGTTFVLLLLLRYLVAFFRWVSKN